MANPLQEAIERVLRDYPTERYKQLRSNPIARFIRIDLREVVLARLTQDLPNHNLIVSTTKFIGNWAHVPWFAVLDPTVAKSTQRGVYVVCLFAEQGEVALLSVAQGVTNNSIEQLDQDRRKILGALTPPPGFEEGPPPAAALGDSTRSGEYEASVVFYKEYRRNRVPPDDDIIRDILSAIEFITQLKGTMAFSQLSFNQQPPEPYEPILFCGVTFSSEDLLDAFNKTAPPDKNSVVDNDWILEVKGERKPLRGVFLTVLGQESTEEFTSEDAAKVAQKLGFNVVRAASDRAGHSLQLRQSWSFAPGRNADRWEEMRSSSEIAIGWDELGDLTQYKSATEMLAALKSSHGSDREPTNNARCNWEFTNVMRPGDLIYARKGRRNLVGIGEVTGPCRWDDSRADFKNFRPVKWHRVGNWALPEGDQFTLKTLTNISESTDLLERMNELAGLSESYFGDDATIEEPPSLRESPEFTAQMLSAKSGHSEEWLSSILGRLKRKKHLVLQGPPGTGKSFLAKELAKVVTSGTSGIVEMIQFHAAYSYEDFVQGIRPLSRSGSVSFALTPGHFLRFCERARALPNNAPAVLIIDEFNRADPARVFGELMLLLEYREEAVPLAAGGARFSIPGNVLIIATMNTADRSIALVNHALRRRFTFVAIRPNYDILHAYLTMHRLPADSLVSALRAVNDAIQDPDYYVGISYFLQDGPNLRQCLKEIWQGEIEPYLDEYFYNDKDSAARLTFDYLSDTTFSEWQ